MFIIDNEMDLRTKNILSILIVEHYICNIGDRGTSRQLHSEMVKGGETLYITCKVRDKSRR